MSIHFWEIHFCIYSSWKDRKKCKSKLHLKQLCWPGSHSSAEIEADCWNARVKLPGVWKCVVWMVLQQPSESPRPSEVAFGCGKGSDVVAPIPTELCGALGTGHLPGHSLTLEWQQEESRVLLLARQWCLCLQRCAGTVPAKPGCPWGARVTAPCMSHPVFTQTLGCSAFPPVHTPNPGLHHCSAWPWLSKTLKGKAPGKIWRKSQPADREGLGVGCCSCRV